MLLAKWDGHSAAPHEVVFRVVSSREGRRPYCVDFLDGVWSCTCGQEAPCAHVAAVQLVTLPQPLGAAVGRAVAS